MLKWLFFFVGVLFAVSIYFAVTAPAHAMLNMPCPPGVNPETCALSMFGPTWFNLAMVFVFGVLLLRELMRG